MLNQEKIKKDLNPLNWSWMYSKYSFVAIFSIVIIYLLNPLLEQIIIGLFVSQECSSSILIDIAVILLSVYLAIFAIKLAKNNYRPSFNQYLLSVLIILSYSLLRFGEPAFRFDNFQLQLLSNLHYTDLISLSVLLFPAGKLLFGEWLKKYVIVTPAISNLYLEDKAQKVSPKQRVLVDRISQAIVHDKYESSFSIGIIGPWGNGKTTFLNGVSEKIEPQVKEKSIIQINFSPFLNHNDDEVITEFFNTFSNALSEHSGKLSMSILTYASTISKLYKRGELGELFSRNGIIKDKPALDLYNDIKEQLQDLDVKIVVFVDDLDRLNSKEIIQVFKLIRNTSNFANTIFILALDKNYVVNALASDKSYLESQFIDKFFQLEIFVPLTEKIELISFVLDGLKRSTQINENDFKRFEESIIKENFLFYEYVKNYRDALRILNQIVFEYSVIGGLGRDVSVNDFINLIFLKTRYPQIFQDIRTNMPKYFNYSNGEFSLKKKQNDLQTTDFEDMFTPQIDETFLINDVFTANKTEHNFTVKERHLLILTLIQLFGNSPAPYDSIMKERNYWKLIRSRYAVDDLREEEVDRLFDLANSDETTITGIDKLLSSNKGHQLITTLNYYTITTKSQLTRFVKILFHLYKKTEQNHLYFSEIPKLLAKLLNLNRSSGFGANKGVSLTPIETKNLFFAEFLENPTISISGKIFLLKLLFENKDETSLWGFNEMELNKIGVELFQKHLDLYSSINWVIEDFSIYNLYQNLKIFCDNSELHRVFKQFLKTQDVSIFCAQMLNPMPFAVLTYKISELVVEFFGSFLDFKNYVLIHKDHETPAVKEFLEFMHLLFIVSFNQHIKFVFKFLTILDHTAYGTITEFDKKQSELKVQMFVSIKNEVLKTPYNLGDLDMESYVHRFHAFEGKTYLNFSTTKADWKDCLKTVFNALYKKIREKDIHLQIDLRLDYDEKTGLIKENVAEGETLVELISLQYGA